jgi:cytochrome b6-f complex iron-sulfur subunit
MNRRDLIQRVLVGGAILVLVPTVLQSCKKSASTSPGAVINGNKINLDLTLSENSVLNNAGGSLIVQNLIVINTGGGNYSALSKICTHQGCTVGYDSASGNIKCPCHGSVYATSGSVITGPAPSALTSYAISRTGDILTITI